MGVARLAAIGALATAAAACLAAASWAGSISSAAKCGNPKLQPLATSVGIRGYAACSDDATAIVRYQRKTYRFGFKPQPSGVCWKDSTLPLQVEIGTILNGRKKSDAPGFSLGLVSPKSITTNTISFGITVGGRVVHWSGPIAVAKKGNLGGTFKDARSSGGKWVASGKLVTGSWSCERVLVVPT